MAAELSEFDPRAAERLGDLASSVGTEAGRLRWGDVDLRRAFNTERLARAYAQRRLGRPATVDWADRARNVLVLLPILLTWFALGEASKAYASYLATNADAVRFPFLLLWQQGFGGEASLLAPSFSAVATIDALVIAIIIALTFFSHGRREAHEDNIQNTAEDFQTRLDNTLAEATVALSSDRSSRGPAVLARAVEQLAERFGHNSQELLNRLRVEHDRLEAIASRREREFADFGVFASGMRAGAEETHRLLIDLRQVSTGLQTALEDLTSEVGTAGDQQRALLSAIQALDRLVGAGIQSDQDVMRQIDDTARSLGEAADKGLSGAEAAAQAGRVASEAVRGIAELASGLATSQMRVEAAVAGEAEANSRLADALRASTGGVAATSKVLHEVGGGLSHLRQEFGQLAEQMSNQTGSLGALLNEQRNVGSGLAQVARDLGAIGNATGQRQREMNEEISMLVKRLDGVANVLARATTNMPTPEALHDAFAAALRTELMTQADQIAEALDAHASGGIARRDRGLWPRQERR